MNRFCAVFAGLFSLLAFLALGCQSGQDSSSGFDLQELRKAKRPEHDAATEPILKQLSAATKVSVYEGLPHDGFEQKLFKEELETKETVSMGGYPFYKEPIEVAPDTMELIVKLCRDGAAYEPLIGAKGCGGFHPDWSITFGEGDTACHVLLCFGCQEAKLIAPGEQVHCDLSRATYEALHGLLKPLRKNRPLKEG